MSLSASTLSSGWYINFAWAVGGIILGYIGGAVVNKSNGGKYRTLGGIGILMLVALGAMLNYTNNIDLQDSVTCQRKFNEQYRRALQAQLDATHRESRAQDEFLLGLNPTNGTTTPLSVFIERRDKYFSDKAAAEKLRVENPIPIANLCGGG